MSVRCVSNMDVHIFSFYRDIGFVNRKHQCKQAKEQDARNQSLWMWMENNNLHRFPMRADEFQEVAHLFKFLTEQNALVTLLFSLTDGCKERGCMLLRAGRWECFPSSVDAALVAAAC